MRSYYDLMSLSEEKASDGTYYPDVFSLSTNEFKFNSIPSEHFLNSVDILRPDLLVSNYYGFSDYYDLLLDINEIPYVKNKNPGEAILFPTITELDEFYLRNSK